MRIAIVACAFVCASFAAAHAATPVAPRRAPAAPKAQYIYVTNHQISCCFDSIEWFARNANGNVAPRGVIAGASTGLSGVSGVVVDGQGTIWSAQDDTASLLGFRTGASGSVPPSYIITGSKTHLQWPAGMALDPSGNVLVAICAQWCFSALPDRVLSFAPDQSGNVAPLTDIFGKKTGLKGTVGVAVDGEGNAFAENAQANTVTEYASGATGHAKPVCTLEGFALLSGGIATDAANDLYVAAAPNSGPSSVFVYAPPYCGTDPIRTISGSNTTLGQAPGLFVDAGGRLYATTQYPSTISVFAAEANGNVAPVQYIAGGKTGMNGTGQVFVR
jgi:hypothetical protein